MGQLPKEGKRKGGIKAHTVIDLSDNMPCLIRYTEAARHDMFYCPKCIWKPAVSGYIERLGQLPKEGKRKGGIKAHTVIDLSDNMPCLIRYTEAARHDMFYCPKCIWKPAHLSPLTGAM